MDTVGPLLVRRDTDKTLYWCQLTLGGQSNQTVWLIQLNPFNKDEAVFPATEALTEIAVEPLTLHAFDPSSGRYFSLTVTEEHELLQYRAINPPTNLNPFIAEQYTNSAWVSKRPPLRAPDNVKSKDDGYQLLYKTLRENIPSTDEEASTLETVAISQYQTTLTSSDWDIERQTSTTKPVSLDTSYGILNQTGFFLGLSYLKTTASSRLSYCHALIRIIAHDEKKQLADDVLSLEEDIIKHADALRRYLFDPDIYKNTGQALDDAFFTRIRHLLLCELNLCLAKLPDTSHLQLQTSDLLSFEETPGLLAANTTLTPEMITVLSDNFYHLLTGPPPVTSYLSITQIRNTKDLTHTLLNNRTPGYDIVYDLIADAFNAHHPHKSLVHELQSCLTYLTNIYMSRLKEKVSQCLQSNPIDEASLTTLLPHLKTAEDVAFTLIYFDTIGKTRLLLDALHLEDPQCPQIQSIDDLNTINQVLATKDIAYLFQKRTPAMWATYLHSPRDLEEICWVLNMPEKNKLFKANAARFARFVDFDKALISILPHINEYQLKQLLQHIPISTTRHWIQTPSAFQALFNLKINASQCKKTRLILNTIPSPYRVTALIQCTTQEKQAHLLEETCKSSWISLYWQSLSPEEWNLLFKTLGDLKACIEALQTSNGTRLMSHMPALIKETLYQTLETEALRLGVLPTPDSDHLSNGSFEDLKTACVESFPLTLSASNSFFSPITDRNTIEPRKKLTNTLTPSELKHILIDIFCLTKNAAFKASVLNACLLIKAYENHIDSISETHRPYTDAPPPKRSCFA